MCPRFKLLWFQPCPEVKSGWGPPALLVLMLSGVRIDGVPLRRVLDRGLALAVLPRALSGGASWIMRRTCRTPRPARRPTVVVLLPTRGST